MSITSGDILTFLYIIVGVMLIVVLYHLLFIVVDLRKTMRRIEGITSQIEEVILKPLAIIDQTFEWILGRFEKKPKHPHHGK